MPRHNQEQQEPQRKQGTTASVRHIERLVIDDLAGNACIVLSRCDMLMQQPDAVEAKQAEQCELDGPDAPTLPTLTWPVAHALLDCKCPSAAIRHH
jgi:hypothetical protein